MKKLVIATGCFTITWLVLTSKLVAQVGVGTSTPTAGTKLEIVGAGTTSATTALRVRNSSSSTPLLMVRDDGNVGIGTITPSAGLEIVTDGSQLNALRVSSSQTYSSTSIPDVGMAFRYKYNTNGDYALGAIISSAKENSINNDQSGSLHFWTNNNIDPIARRMTITSEGNVGIGTTSITTGTRLEVSGNISIKSGADAYVQTTDANNLILRAHQQAGASGKGLRFQYWNGAGWQNALYFDNVTSSGYTNLIMQSAGGNVGIGTITPTYKLDVTGDINASSSVRANGVILTSDARLKNIVQSWNNDDEIDFVQFRWKNGIDNRDHYGYLAQDVQKVLPDAVQTDNEGMMSVNYDEVHSYKLAMQEKRIKELEQTVDELKKVIKRKRVRRKA
jgi:Chaperone of endosialidase